MADAHNGPIKITVSDPQSGEVLAEKLLECWSGPFRMQVITGRGDAFPEQGVGARKDRDEPSCPRL